MPLVHPTEAARLARQALQSRGLSAKHAEWMAQALVSTSQRGVDTHGLRLLPLYIQELEHGRANPSPQWRWSSPKPAIAQLDADAAPGVVAGLVAAQRAATLARARGIGLVNVVNSNHFGAASIYTLLLAHEGLIGICFSNTDPLMAVLGGSTPTLGTNPMSVAVPTGDEPFCLDMATSQIAWGRVLSTWRTEGRLPPDWARDADGRDCSAPDTGAPVVASPLGGYKGAGLALAIELICGGFAGAHFGNRQTHLFGAPWDRPREVAHTLIAIDAAAFGDQERTLARIFEYLAWYRAQERADGKPGIVPGDLEAREAATRGTDLWIDDDVANALEM